MKNLFIPCFVLLLSVMHAHEYDIINHIWHFEKIVVEETEYYMPVNAETPPDGGYLTFYFENGDFFGTTIINGFSLASAEVNSTDI